MASLTRNPILCNISRLLTLSSYGLPFGSSQKSGAQIWQPQKKTNVGIQPCMHTFFATFISKYTCIHVYPYTIYYMSKLFTVYPYTIYYISISYLLRSILSLHNVYIYILCFSVCDMSIHIHVDIHVNIHTMYYTYEQVHIYIYVSILS